MSSHELDAIGLSGSGEGGTATAGPPTILLIDDDRQMCEALALACGSNYRFETRHTAKSGVEALRPATSAVILDIKMGDADGFSAYRAIREIDPDVPIIFYSAYQNVKNPYEIINEYRPFGYVFKGADLRELLSLIEKAVCERERMGFLPSEDASGRSA